MPDIRAVLDRITREIETEAAPDWRPSVMTIRLASSDWIEWRGDYPEWSPIDDYPIPQEEEERMWTGYRPSPYTTYNPYDSCAGAWIGVLLKNCTPNPDEVFALGKTHAELGEMFLNYANPIQRDKLLDEATQHCTTLEGRLAEWAIGYNGLDGAFRLNYLLSDAYLPQHQDFHTLVFKSIRSRGVSQVREFVDDGNIEGLVTRMPWEVRELVRLHDRYVKVPFKLPRDCKPIRGHFLHISERDPTLLAFTENDNKGKRDIQTPIKAGRYLKRFYTDMDEATIVALQAEMAGSYDVKFAKTADEIYEVYRNRSKINSCMSGEVDEYESHVHPTAVYGDSDLQVAYMTAPNNGTVIARCLVWPEKKAVGRMYGDIDKLKVALRLKGYTVDDIEGYALRGARIRRIENETHPGTLVMPYIDAFKCAGHLDKDWLVIGGNCHQACWTNGTDSEDPASAYHHCSECEDEVDEEDTELVYFSRYDRREVCPNCARDAVYCDGWGLVDSDQTVEVVVTFRPGTVEPRTRRNVPDWTGAYTWCDGIEEYVSDDHEFLTLEDGDTVCLTWFLLHGITIDGKHYSKENAEALGLTTEEAA